jgi:hypothetical protein
MSFALKWQQNSNLDKLDGRHIIPQKILMQTLHNLPQETQMQVQFPIQPNEDNSPLDQMETNNPCMRRKIHMKTKILTSNPIRTSRTTLIKILQVESYHTRTPPTSTRKG